MKKKQFSIESQNDKDTDESESKEVEVNRRIWKAITGLKKCDFANFLLNVYSVYHRWHTAAINNDYRVPHVLHAVTNVSRYLSIDE